MRPFSASRLLFAGRARDRLVGISGTGRECGNVSQTLGLSLGYRASLALAQHRRTTLRAPAACGFHKKSSSSCRHTTAAATDLSSFDNRIRSRSRYAGTSMPADSESQMSMPASEVKKNGETTGTCCMHDGTPRLYREVGGFATTAVDAPIAPYLTGTNAGGTTGQTAHLRCRSAR